MFYLRNLKSVIFDDILIILTTILTVTAMSFTFGALDQVLNSKQFWSNLAIEGNLSAAVILVNNCSSVLSGLCFLLYSICMIQIGSRLADKYVNDSKVYKDLKLPHDKLAWLNLYNFAIIYISAIVGSIICRTILFSITNDYLDRYSISVNIMAITKFEICVFIYTGVLLFSPILMGYATMKSKEKKLKIRKEEVS